LELLTETVIAIFFQAECDSALLSVLAVVSENAVTADVKTNAAAMIIFFM
jgi:hypothetical protein